MKQLTIIIILINILLPINNILAASAQSTSTVSLIVGAVAVCGDGSLDAGEVCDDGNSIDCDGCKSDCSRLDNVCGDSIVECGEICESGDNQACTTSNGYAGAQLCNATCNGWQTCVQIEEIVGGGTILPEIFEEINIYSIFTRIGVEEAVINWLTNKNAYCRLNWGETQDLKDGSIEGIEKKDQHRAHLTSLTPDTDYYFQIFCWDNWGHKKQTLVQKLRTKELVDKTPPANVSDFIAIPDIDKILLSWKNPADEDFRAVKIMRSEEFYPLSISEGIEVYNDSGESTIDYKVKVGIRYYYTAFAYDNNANYASGAIAAATIGEEIVSPLPEVPWARPEEIIEVSVTDFEFLVANNSILLSLAPSAATALGADGIDIALLPGTILGVRTKRANFPDVLKSIILTIVPKEEATLKEKMLGAKSYLLRKENEFFSTLITAPIKIKDYDFYLSVLNLRNAMIARAEGLLDVEQFGQVIKSKLLSLIAQPVYASDLTLYQFEEGEFKKWPGYEYSQFNPIYSNKQGQYGFLVPNGQYYLKADKNNFFTYHSIVFTIENNLLNEDIELIYYPQFNWKQFILLLLILLIIYIIIRKRIIKLKQFKNKESHTI